MRLYFLFVLILLATVCEAQLMKVSSPNPQTLIFHKGSGNLQDTVQFNGGAGCWIFQVGTQTTSITKGLKKFTFRLPFAVKVTGVRANLSTASSTGQTVIDINANGTSILSTKITIDKFSKTSTTSAFPPIVVDSVLPDDSEITIDYDLAGYLAKGIKIVIYYERL